MGLGLNGNIYIHILQRAEQSKAKTTNRWELVEYMAYTVLHSTMTGYRMTGVLTAPRAPSYSRSLFLSSLNNIPVLTGDDLDLWGRNVFVRFHLERRILHQERPHVVAQSVCMEVTLQGSLCLDLLDHDVCKRLVELLQNFHCELGGDRPAGDELVKRVGKGHSDG